MDNKLHQLLSILKNKEGYVNSSFLSSQLGVSVRTIKNYIYEINKAYPKMITSTNKGYVLNKKLFSSLPDKKDDSLPQNSSDRISYIINQLVSLDKDYTLNLYDLCDDLYVSESTLKRDLKEIQEILKDYNLQLINYSGNIHIDGKEQHKRLLINSMISKECENNNFSLEQIEEMFPGYDLYQIKAIVTEKCRDFNYIINGFTIDRIILDIVIQIDRISKSFDTEKETSPFLMNVHEHVLATEIIQSFENIYHIKYNEDEIEAFTIVLFTHLMKIDYQKITDENLKTIVGNQTYNLSKEIIQETQNYFLKNQNNEFFVRFTLHLHNLLLRAKTNYINHNSMTETIKNTCPLLFDCAVSISNIINKKTGYSINEDEIAYIAIHIGTLIEDDSNKISCLLILPEYYSISTNLYDELKNKFNDKADIILSHVFSMDDIKDYDLIITNDPYLNIPNNKKIIISGIINNKDIHRIENKIKEVEDAKNKEILINHLVKITSEQFFYINPDVKYGEDFIRFACTNLIKYGIINENYSEDVLYREQISSTAFNKISVPHSLQMHANKTAISIAIFDKPINWFGKKVEVVFMFAINQADKQVFHFVFDNLVSLLIDDYNIGIIKKCKTYQDFINCIPNIKNF